MADLDSDKLDRRTTKSGRRHLVHRIDDNRWDARFFSGPLQELTSARQILLIQSLFGVLF